MTEEDEAFNEIERRSVAKKDAVKAQLDKPQRTWVELTDSQIEQVYFEVVKEHRGAPMPWGQVQFGKVLQDKLKEKNT
jgi:uncharacterized protein YecT (DUF1311 family)